MHSQLPRFYDLRVLFQLLIALPTLSFAAEDNWDRNSPTLSFNHVVVDFKPPHNPWIKLAGDFNQDGKLDLAIGGQAGPLVWYTNPNWQPHEIATSGWATVGGAVGDMDGDGDADIVPGAQIWFENPMPHGDPANGVWHPHKISELRSHDVVLGDLNGDGRLDLVARDQSGFGHQTGNQIHLWFRVDPDAWQYRSFACPHGEGLAVADLDRDGDLDVVIAGQWFENTGKFEKPWPTHSFTSLWAWLDAKIALGDMNQDGLVDIVLAPAEHQGQQYRLAWYEAPKQTQQSEWREHVVAGPVEAVMHALRIEDMNVDGQLDIVSAQMHQGAPPQRVRVHLNLERGSRWKEVIVSDQGSHDILVGDFNGDGLPDIVGANHGGPSQPVDLWLNEGKN